MLKKLIHSVLNLIFPQKCLGCEKENPPIGGICQKCMEKIDFPSLISDNNIFSAADYNDKTVKKALWQLKYKGRKELAEPLAELIFQRLFKAVRPPFGDRTAKQNWLIIPIPLHKNRLKARGFNQSELIAQKLGLKTNLEIKNNALYKIKETPTQVSIKNRQARLKNLQGAFEIKNPDLIKNKNILLIDDISTTGATIKECKKVLRTAGAKKIIGLVVARG